MATRRSFYKKSQRRKKPLRQVIRPTYAKSAAPETDVEEQEIQTQSPEFFPVKSTSTRAKSTIDAVGARVLTKPATKYSYDAEPDEDEDDQVEVESKSDPSDEISRISQMIKQASAKLAQLEEQKRIQEEEAARSRHDEVEEFDGMDDDEEKEMLREQLEQYRMANNRLKKEMTSLKTEFEEEKSKLERDIHKLRNETGKFKPVADNKLFSFSTELSEAIKAIDSLKDPNFTPVASEVVIKADELPPEPKTILLDVDKPVVATPAPVATPTVVEPEKPKPEAAATEVAPDNKKSKEKKLLVTGVTVLVVMFGGGALSYALTSKPAVDGRLVEEYLENNPTQVLGAQSPKASVPDGIVADKNSDAAYDETQWADYRDPVMGFSVRYPANVTERLHTSSSVTFMRKDSFIFKINRYTSDKSVAEYWESIKDKGVKYEAEEITFVGQPALKLELQEIVQYPGDRYLVMYDGVVYDIWFATDPGVYGADDVKRAKDMLDSFRII